MIPVKIVSAAVSAGMPPISLDISIETAAVADFGDKVLLSNVPKEGAKPACGGAQRASFLVHQVGFLRPIRRGARLVSRPGLIIPKIIKVAELEVAPDRLQRTSGPFWEAGPLVGTDPPYTIRALSEMEPTGRSRRAWRGWPCSPDGVDWPTLGR